MRHLQCQAFSVQSSPIVKARKLRPLARRSLHEVDRPALITRRRRRYKLAADVVDLAFLARSYLKPQVAMEPQKPRLADGVTFAATHYDEQSSPSPAWPLLGELMQSALAARRSLRPARFSALQLHRAR